MSFRPIQDGTPMSANTLNRYLANSSHVWKASTSFSGTWAYNFNNIIDNTTATPTNPALFTRIVISNLVAASGTGLFMRLIDTAFTVVATNNYYCGYYGIDSSNVIRTITGAPQTVFLVGDIGLYNYNVTLDIFHLTGTTTQINGYGASNGGGTATSWPAVLNVGGQCAYVTNPIAGIQLLSFGAVNFSGKLNAYQQRRIV